jgi:hypothetical protein
MHVEPYLARFFLEREMFKPKAVEKLETYFVFDNFFFEESAVYEIMWKNSVQPDRPHMTIRHMCIAYWIRQATNTYSEYVAIPAFPLQQWLHERASMLRYTTFPVMCLFCQ